MFGTNMGNGDVLHTLDFTRTFRWKKCRIRYDTLKRGFACLGPLLDRCSTSQCMHHANGI